MKSKQTEVNKYNILVRILDKICEEAPKTFKRYYPPEGNQELLNKARSLAYIHLYLKVKFGLISFSERENLICDGSNDGGIDAYYINTDNRTVYFIQSKFRTNPDNFVNKEIELEEIIAMDINNITSGEDHDEEGNEYNGKIKGLMRNLSSIPDISQYKYKVVILANLKSIKQTDLKKFTDQIPAEVFNRENCIIQIFKMKNVKHLNKSLSFFKFQHLLGNFLFLSLNI